MARRETFKGYGPYVGYEFLRVVTHPRVMRRPWTMAHAVRFLEALQVSPGLAFLVPTDAPGCNYRANRSCCEVAGRAMQTCGGVGYSRHMPFEHIYRHHRRYRITEGSEEIQMRKVAQQLFGF